MKAIIGGALVAIGLAGAAAGQEQPAGSYTRIHGAYVALDPAADHSPATGSSFMFAGLDARRASDTTLRPADATPTEAVLKNVRSPAPDGPEGGSPPPAKPAAR